MFWKRIRTQSTGNHPMRSDITVLINRQRGPARTIYKWKYACLIQPLTRKNNFGLSPIPRNPPQI